MQGERDLSLWRWRDEHAEDGRGRAAKGQHGTVPKGQSMRDFKALPILVRVEVGLNQRGIHTPAASHGTGHSSHSGKAAVQLAVLSTDSNGFLD